MKVLVLGGDGMIGHRLFLHLGQNHDVHATVRRDLSAYREFGLFHAGNTIDRFEAGDEKQLEAVLERSRPNAVVNCIGIVKQRSLASEVIPCLKTNALFPHQAALACRKVGARFVQLTTDCVFSGKKGNYREEDIPDPQDLYGQTKHLGEVLDPGAITVRTSSIGLELGRKQGLIEWFLAQKGPIRGFRKAIYSGLTTTEMSRVIENVLVSHSGLTGLWHVSGEPIDKYTLLKTFSKLLGRRDVEITPDDDFVCDRSLNSERFRRETGYHPPSWQTLLEELVTQVKQGKAA